MKKISILFTRSFKILRMGGVTTYVRQLIDNLNRQEFCVLNLKEINSFREELSSSGLVNSVKVKIHLFLFGLLFPYRLFRDKPDLIHCNPSFSVIPILREAYFIVWAAIFRKKKVVFIHGWNANFEAFLLCHTLARLLFSKIYNLADITLVLSSSFESSLRRLGIKNKVVVETTMIGNEIADEKEVMLALRNKETSKTLKVLFLSRIVRSKGIYEAINAFHIVREETNASIRMLVAGDGPELPKVKNLTQKARLTDIHFLGYVTGERKKATYLEADIFIFPTYSEGLPISVLEAMYFGLPVITRPVGGIKDFFEHGKHGYFTESKEPSEFAKYLELLLSDTQKRLDMSRYNHEYAKRHFLASAVVRRMERIYASLVHGKDQC